jgi:V8-like Glu-specific endopeptidase
VTISSQSFCVFIYKDFGLRLPPKFLLMFSMSAFSMVLLNASCGKNVDLGPTAENSSEKNTVRPQGVYGKDDRHDVFAEPKAAIRLLADSTVLVIRHTDLSYQPDGTVNIATRTLADSQAACHDEPFREQETAGFCSGFLVAPDTIVTAGHCISNEKDCSETSLVFGFSLTSPTKNLKTVTRNEIYRCAQVIHAQTKTPGADFSIITLDREVHDHIPLKLRQSGEPQPGENVMVIGYPLGLPTKIAGGAQIRSIVPETYFTANLDTYAGNSGSPVFHGETLEVEGILVRGGRDFYYRAEERCYASVRCDDDKCRGEDVTLISEVLKYLGSANNRDR